MNKRTFARRVSFAVLLAVAGTACGSTGTDVAVSAAEPTATESPAPPTAAEITDPAVGSFPADLCERSEGAAPTAPAPPSPPQAPFESGPGGVSDLPAANELAVGEFLLDIDGAVTPGSGIAFIEEDGSLFIRLLNGRPNSYLEFNYLPQGAESPLTLSERDAPALIIGQDAVSGDYTIADPSRGGLLFFEQPRPDTAAGSFQTLIADTSGSQYCMTGVFHVAANQSTEWGCDFDGELVSDCGFES